MVARRGREINLNSIGGRIQAARIAKGLTQEQLAQLLGVTKSIISQWEGDRIEKISSPNLLKLSTVLEVNALWLLDYKDDKGHILPMGRPIHLHPDESDLIETFKLLEPQFRDALLGDAHKYLKLSASHQKPSRANPYPKAVKPKK